MGEAPRLYSEHTWESFVRPAVRFKAQDPDTRALAEQLMPYFPKSCIVIAAYLDDADQFWKVNYHWEYLSRRVNVALSLKVTADSRSALDEIRKNLDLNAPNPAEGYADSKKLGEPHDKSSPEKIIERWRSMKDDKAKFRKVVDSEKLTVTRPPAVGWDLAAAPVAKPGTSKHGCGFAFDIHGPDKNLLIKSICKGLGATLVFDEKSHVHVEFKQGVLVAKGVIPEDFSDGCWSGWRHLA